MNVAINSPYLPALVPPRATHCRAPVAGWGLPEYFRVPDHNLIIHDAAVRAEPSAVSRQREIDDPICETKSGGILAEHEGSVRGVADGDCHLFLAVVVAMTAPVGTGNGSMKKADFIPLVLSNLQWRTF
jgi:hypothetical protein